MLTASRIDILFMSVSHKVADKLDALTVPAVGASLFLTINSATALTIK